MIGATESIETPTTPEETNQTRRAHHRDWRNNESVGMAREIYIGEAKFVDGSDLVKVRSAVATWHARTGRTELYWAKSRWALFPPPKKKKKIPKSCVTSGDFFFFFFSFLFFFK